MNTQPGAPSNTPATEPTMPPRSDGSGFIGKVEATLNEWMVTKAPFQLPMGAKDVIVKIMPWVIIVLAVLFLPVLLGALGLSAMMTPFGMMADGMVWGWMMLVSVGTGIIAFVLEVMAVPGLFKRTHKSWRLLFYASLVSFVGSILSMNIIGGIIGAVIGWYFLFQIKDHYRN